MKKTLLLSSIAVALALAGCGNHNSDVAPQAVAPQQMQPQAAPAAGAAPVIVNNVPAQASGGGDSGLSNMLLGGVIGHMIGSSGSRNAAPNYQPAHQVTERVIEKRTIIKEVPAKPAQVAQAAPAPKPAAPAPAPAKPNYSAVTSTTTYSKPSPSYSSYRSTTSYSGGKR